MPYAPAGDIDLFYEVSGRGEPLLLLPGFGSWAELWSQPFLTALASRCQLLLPDPRGTGRSPRGSEPLTMERLVADALAVLDHEGALSAHVLGVSLGGMVAQQLTAEHPARVRGLVLGCTTPGGPEETPPRRVVLEEVQRHGPLGGNLASLLVSPGYLKRRTGLLSRLALRAGARPTPLATLRDQFEAAAPFDFSGRLQEILTPTLVITGDQDVVIPPANARLLTRGIRGAHGVLVKDTGHCFYWEAPERAATAITDFLASARPSSLALA